MSSRNEEVEAWYKANAENIKKWANKRSKQDAEDILQDTAVKLLVSPNKWEAISRKDVTRRMAWSFYNEGFGANNALNVPIETAESIESPEDPMTNIIAKKSLNLVLQLLNSLDEPIKSAYTGFNTGKRLLPIHKKVFIMRFFDEMGYEEIAKKLDLTHHSARELGSQANRIVVNKFKEIMNENT